MHRLLQRQLEKYFGATDTVPPDLRNFLQAIEEAYLQADSDRKLLERSLDLTSQELLERNDQLRKDVDQRRRAEETLRRYADDLARSNADLEQFAYVASHDLQEPLRLVASYAQLLERRYKGRFDKDADEYIEFVVTGAMRMQRLILDLLDYSRVGRQTKPHVPVAVDSAVDEALANLKQAISESGAQVTHSPQADAVVWADRIQLVRVFQNLVGNALKFTKPGEAPRIEILIRGGTKEWMISIRDHGIGIDPCFKERLFIIFQRLHTRDEYPGTGIGLAVCKKIVERHGGRIAVESQHGAGSTFFFTLPAAKPASDSPSKA